MNYRGVDIPRVSFGAVTSDDLFCDKEQALFDLYERNKDRYHRALDIGANIGVHSIMMARLGWSVRAYEPDTYHMSLLMTNTLVHGVVAAVEQSAVSNYDGEADFIRVMGNTTGSHLAGLKKPYGDLEVSRVKVVNASALFAWADFAKIDAEGAEADIVSVMPPTCDAVLEIGNEKNGRFIWAWLCQHKRRAWAQRTGWGRVAGLMDVPWHHSEGALFIGEGRP